jgi:hypothetical protein
VLAFLSVAVVATFVYLLLAFRTASAHRAYPSPLIAVAFFAVHDASFVLRWNTWFGEYHHWWPEAWAIALIGGTVIELALVYTAWRYGREELCPSLTPRQFGAVIVGALIVISVAWAVIKDLLVDELYLMTFVFTAFMGPAFSIALRAGRQSNRGQTVGMAWALVFTFTGIFGAWRSSIPTSASLSSSHSVRWGSRPASSTCGWPDAFRPMPPG